MCIFHHSHSDILPMTSLISACTYTPKDMYYSVCKYTIYTIITYTNTNINTTYIHTLHPTLHTYTHKYSLMCMQSNIHHAYTHRVNTTNQIDILTSCGTCVHA